MSIIIHPPLKNYIGKEAHEVVHHFKNERNYHLLTDCIGINGHRNITLIQVEKRIEIVCETDQVKEVLNESLAPSEVDWHVIDFFVYYERPKEGKGFY